MVRVKVGIIFPFQKNPNSRSIKHDKSRFCNVLESEDEIEWILELFIPKLIYTKLAPSSHNINLNYIATLIHSCIQHNKCTLCITFKSSTTSPENSLNPDQLASDGAVHCLFVCLFDLILYVPSTIFRLNRDGSSCVEPVLS